MSEASCSGVSLTPLAFWAGEPTQAKFRPLMREVPPRRLIFSIIKTLAPLSAAESAAIVPAIPLPTTITSKLSSNLGLAASAAATGAEPITAAASRDPWRNERRFRADVVIFFLLLWVEVVYDCYFLKINFQRRQKIFEKFTKTLQLFFREVFDVITNT